MPEDPYKTLGLNEGASTKDVNRAFRNLAKKHHPDANPGDKTAEARFKALGAAHDSLTGKQSAAAPVFGGTHDPDYAAELEQRLRERRGPPPAGFGSKVKTMLKFFSRGG